MSPAAMQVVSDWKMEGTVEEAEEEEDWSLVDVDDVSSVGVGVVVSTEFSDCDSESV